MMIPESSGRAFKDHFQQLGNARLDNRVLIIFKVFN